jgi:hypothetical protein
MDMSIWVFMLMLMTADPFNDHCHPGACDTVPLITGDIELPSADIKLFQAVDKGITADTQIEHGAEVHITAYS